MNFLKKLFGGTGLLERGQDPSPVVVRWSDDPRGLDKEGCARKGIESLAGLVITEDIFGTSNHPNEMFCAVVELYYAEAGNSGDFIGVYFREVEFVDQTYPAAGCEFLKMALQPFSDGTVAATWNDIDHSRASESAHGVGMMAAGGRVRVGRSLALGSIPEQEKGDASIPSFIILRAPGSGWQISRRFTPATEDGEYLVKDGYQEEIHIKVYPELDERSNWRFRIHHLPGGGMRIEPEQGVSVRLGDT